MVVNVNRFIFDLSKTKNMTNLITGQIVRIDSTESFEIISISKFNVTVKRNGTEIKKYSIGQFQKYIINMADGVCGYDY